MIRIKMGLSQLKKLIASNKCHHRFKLEDVMEQKDPKCMYCTELKSEIKIKEKL